MITAIEIINDINDALKQFGTYPYHDKGAHEVMDIPKIANHLKQMPAEDIIKVLTEVENSHDDPQPCLSSIFSYLDTWESPEADILFDSTLASKYY